MTEERQMEPETAGSTGVEAENGPDSEEGEIVVEDDVVEEATAVDLASDSRPSGDGATEAACEKESSEEEQEAISPEAALIAQLQEELTEAQAEAVAHMDKLQRLAAEFQNSKKRQERQLSEAIQRASEHMVERLLPVLDDFDLAFGNAPDDVSAEDEAWIDGFRQIQGKLDAILQDQGVTAIARQGEFDPSLHEAITSEPNDEVESGHIIETLRTGYEFKGRVLRPAMVRVAS